jgi:tetratricopeptide (TPR) repeat protein
MKARWSVFFALTALCVAPVSWSAASGGFPESPREQMSNEDRGKASYNAALKVMKEADETADPKKAEGLYKKARKKFQDATTWAPQLAEAWNGVGYTQRKLGSYVAALSAYEQALTLKPGYGEAIEYRGEAFLGLNRIDDAKQAYLDLFAANRALSATLLDSMRTWVTTRRATPNGVDEAALTELEKWITERSQIAAQTASLTRAGSPASWQH